jgi:hypothetical protein
MAKAGGATDPGTPGSWNQYAYVQGDPINGFQHAGHNCLKQNKLKTGHFWRTPESVLGAGGSGEASAFLRCIAWMTKRYIETENRRHKYQPVSSLPILPRWFTNQWVTDSLFAHANFHFL